MKLKTLLGSVVLLATMANVSARSEGFDYLSKNGKTLESKNAVNLKLQVTEDFQALDEIHYEANFHNHPFKISMASFIHNTRIIAMHAEQVTDNSGFLDYSYLESTTFQGIDFFLLARCATLSDADVTEATDLSHYKANGFDFAPNIYLYQLFKTSPDGNNEVVITYGEKVPNCTKKHESTEFKAAVKTRLEQTITLELTQQG